MGFFDEDNNSDYRTGVWADCPLLAIEADPSLAYVYMEDFLDFEAITDADAPTLDCRNCGTEMEAGECPICKAMACDEDDWDEYDEEWGEDEDGYGCDLGN